MCLVENHKQKEQCMILEYDVYELPESAICAYNCFAQCCTTNADSYARGYQ